MEAGNAHDLSPGLLRQRRNLMVASAGLMFLGLAEAKLDSVQILGVKATFGRPEAVVTGLLAITVYFAYRYLLYLAQEPGPGLRAEYFARLNRYAKKKVVQLRDTKFPSAEGLHLEEPLGIRKVGWKTLVPSGRDGAGGYEVSEMTVHFHQVWKEAIGAAVFACLARSYFTDYVCPLLLASFAIVVGFERVVF